MKKNIFILIALIVLTSCYSNRILVGNVTPNEPLIEVGGTWNHHIIYGLIPLGNTSMIASEYVNNQSNYVVKTYISFLSGLVSGVTFGLYTPTETRYYLPLKNDND